MTWRSLLLLLALSSASAQSAPMPNLPSQAPLAAVQIDVAPNLPTLILSARQVVLYAPALQRPDVAEAVRRALTERGTQVFLITTRTPLFTDNSYSFRLLLMKVPTYLTTSQSTPFVLIDGRAVTGPGVAGPGRAVYAPGADARRLAAWTEQVTRTVKPLDAVQAVKTWVQQKHGVTLR